MIEKKHNIFYKTTNNVNGKYYYGVHSTDNLNDGYIGSGKTILKAIKKYGKENFSKEIIADYSTRKEASDHEKLIVTLELIELDECYNIRLGGDKECGHSQKTKKLISELRTGKFFGENNAFYGKHHTVESKRKIVENRNTRRGELHPMFGKKHKPETIDKILKSKKGKQTGSNNPMFGRKHTEDSKIKMGNSKRGKKLSEEDKKLRKFTWNTETNPRAKKCEICNKTYNSFSEAGRDLGIGEKAVRGRVRSENPKWKNWKLI